MPRVSIPVASEFLIALESVEAGVRGIVTAPFGTRVPGVGPVHLELQNGRWLELRADQHDVTSKFEVFSITAALIDIKPTGSLCASLDLTPPVSFTVLYTEDWLDPRVECGPTLGMNPIAQVQGAPGAAPAHASVACLYPSGVKLQGGNERSLIVATLPFPFSLYCSALPEGASFDEGAHKSLREA